MSVFDDAAAELADIWAQMHAETLSPEDAAPLIAAQLELVAPSQFIQFTKIEQVMGRITGLFFVTEAPDPTLGAPGASAIDLVNKQFYGPKDAVTGWPDGLQFGPEADMAFTSGTNTWTGDQSFSTPLRLSAGSASAPSLTLTGDLNTGFWSPGADTLAASTGGSERFRITSAGNVGIGSTSPNSKLQLEGPFLANQTGGSDAANSISTPYTVAMSIIDTGALGTGRGGSIGFGGASGGGTSPYLWSAIKGGKENGTSGNYAGYFSVWTIAADSSSAERFRITSGGNVGIGTTSPLSTLDVNGSISVGRNASGQILFVGNGDSVNAQQINIKMSGTDAVIDATRNSGTGPNMLFMTDSSEKMRLTHGGSVGIGTSSPLARLHVAGQALAGANPTYRGDIVIDQVGSSAASNGGLEFKVDNANSGYGHRIKSAYDGGSAYDLIIQNRNNSASWSTRMIVNVDGYILPGADNAQNFGAGSLRWGTIYAASGTINTSDERYKVIREGGCLSEAEFAAWSHVRAIVYQDKDSFDRKGDDARLHVGYSWQAIAAAFAAQGLDANRYGLWCEDPMLAPVTKTRTARRQATDAGGNPVTQVVPVLDGAGQPVVEQVQATEAVDQPFEEVRMIDGAPVLVKGVRTVAQPVFDSVQIKGEDGELLFDTPAPVEDPGTGELVEVAPVPRMFHVPRMVSQAVTETVPILEDFEEEFTAMEPTGETRGALRYQECAVMEAAWLRRQLALVEARVAALES